MNSKVLFIVFTVAFFFFFALLCKDIGSGGTLDQFTAAAFIFYSWVMIVCMWDAYPEEKN